MPPKKPSQNTQNPEKDKGTPTRYQIVKDGWGSRPNFQYSYGLTMTPEDIEEGNAILDAMIKNDQEARSDK